MTKGIGPVDFICSVMGTGKTAINLVDCGLNYLGSSASAAVIENDIKQAKDEILAMANAIREIKEAINCSAAEAEEILNKRLAKKK